MKLNKITDLFKANKNRHNNLTIFGAALTTMLSMQAYAAEDTTPAASDDIEVIEVTGMLGSMKAAALVKRTDGRIVDAIVAEDIGKLPDNNIAEALQRITGVSINTDFGVGDSVSIRGLPQNRVELNGRSTIGDDRDGISLQDFPSSFLKTVEVVKSPTADMIEGALGGTVSMKTVRPLELDELTGAMSLDFEYADKTENVAPIFSGSIGDNWDLGDAGTFGAIAMLAYQDREIRQDEFIERTLFQDIDVNGLPGNPENGEFIVRDQHTVEQFVEQRERTALNLMLQWAPQSGDGMVYLDLNGTKRSGQQAGSSILGVVGSLETNANTTQDSSGQINDFTLRNDFAIPKTYSDFRETDSFSHALGAEWNLSDNIIISGEIAIASSESVQPDSEFTLRPVQKSVFEETGELVNNVYDGVFYQSGDKLPSIIHSVPDAFTSEQDLALRTFKSVLINTNNDETAARFDIVVDEPFQLDWLTQVKAGVRVTERDYEYTEHLEEIKDIYKNAVHDSDGSLATLWIDDYNAAFPGSFSTISHNNAFDQIGHSGQNDLLTYAAYHGLANAGNTYSELQQLLAGTNLATTGTLRENQEFQDSAYREINEETSAMYVSAYLDFDDITAIVGGRYIQTDLESAVILNGDKVVGKNDYNDFLPSLNVTYTLNDDTLVRFAAAKVMRRADFSELSPAFDVNNDTTKATQGAIDLDPYRATQFDLSVEHYFGEGNMLSFAVYYKDVESFLSSQNTCVADSSTSGQNVTEWYAVCTLDAAGVDNTSMQYHSNSDDAAGLAHVEGLRDAGLTGIDTTKDTNGESGKVQGIEIGYQQHFDFLPGAWSGLGFSANYTFADSEQPAAEGEEIRPLLEISKHTYNLQGFWEYESYAARLAYNYRSEYLATEDEKRVLNFSDNYRDSRGQLDFSASWDINENFTVVANATNLTGEHSVFQSEYGNAWSYTEADRRYTVGVRAKF
ncbi:TonB-dependent receptor [Thalassotalea sp. PLHSN55]|uniref:TonB-dependent receptor n=1 Tax=Thalassotalea sp. PLHSN55 TaxID=3435888 RepID=UPI003F85458B